MKRLPPILHLITGVAVSLLFFIFWVYRSNLRLYDEVSGLMAAGYFTVPNAHILPTLKTLFPAISGGLFFTLSAGMGLCFTAFAVAWLWKRIFSESRVGMIFILSGVIFALVDLNGAGFSLVISAWFLTVFGYLFFVTIRFLEQTTGAKSSGHLFFHVPVMLLLGFLYVPLAGDDIYTRIRDRLLMSSSIGQGIVNFYYQYTLYPAEAIKSLDQKLFVTFHMEFAADNDEVSAVKEALAIRGWLLVDNSVSADIAVRVTGRGEITFSRNKKVIYSVSSLTFLSSPVLHLNAISQKADNHRFIKKMIAYSLAWIFPLIVYTGFSVWAFVFIRRFVSAAKAGALTALFSFSFFLTLFFMVSFQISGEIGNSEIPDALSSGNPQRRVQAIRAICKRGADATAYAPYLLKMIKSDATPERLWATKTLSLVKGPEAVASLRHLLDDPQPNVRCMAVYALGRRGDRAMIPLIMERIKDSRHWYVQWYAYRALKDLGWHNRPSGR